MNKEARPDSSGRASLLKRLSRPQIAFVVSRKAYGINTKN